MLLCFYFQGFQLVFDPKSHRWGQGSIFSLHEALLDLEKSTKSEQTLGHLLHFIAVSVGYLLYKTLRLMALNDFRNVIKVGQFPGSTADYSSNMHIENTGRFF